MDQPLILIIDDEQKQTDMVAKLIEATGRYKTAKAYSAAEGFAVLKKNQQWFRPNKVRLILLDIKMPEMDGLQFLAELRKSYDDQSMGVIMLTAYEDTEKWDKATSGFVVGYLKKPVIEEQLIHALDRFFSDDEARVKMTVEVFARHIEKRNELKPPGSEA
jgi:CheY-like chemotaxis protein